MDSSLSARVVFLGIILSEAKKSGSNMEGGSGGMENS